MRYGIKRGLLTAQLCCLIVGLPFFTSQAIADQSGSDQLEKGLAALDAQDYSAASQLFAEAFKNGAPDGAFYLGRMLELGLGGEQDGQAAIALYVAGSANASALSKNRLGVLHMDGTGVLQDYQRGAELVCEAAELGDANGAFNCANLLLEGKGLEKDEAQAYDWLREASKLGHIGAKNLYANALLEGSFVEQDQEGAIALFEETAAEGNPFGLFSLGQVYSDGLGRERNLVKAHSYLNLAAAFNHPLAASARALIEREMSSEDILAAQQMAKAWKPESNAASEHANADEEIMKSTKEKKTK